MIVHYMKNKFIKILLFITLIGCAQVTSLNLKKHQFGKLPVKIVWLQVAGLTEEHLAMLKYSYPTVDVKTSFENSLCMGKTWAYNLYDIRPEASSGFLSQITGKKNIKNSCEDFKLQPIWSYMLPKGYKVGIFEGESSQKQSLLYSRSSCNNNDFLKDVHFWRMDKKAPSGSKDFHVEAISNFYPNEVYYDKSCLSGECFTTVANNVTKVFESFSRNTNNYLYIVRNFKYAQKIKENRVSEARDELTQLNKIVAYFQGLANKRNDFLLLVTSAEPVHTEFPRSGKEWGAYEKAGKFFKAKKSNLMGTVMVSGARAENFCGIYDQSDILPRIFSGAKQQGLELTIINPFQQ